MKRLIVLPAARRDLARIWAATAERWNIHQADAYIEAINHRFASIAEFPSSYPEYVGKLGSFRKAPSGEHLIFYLIWANRVEVVRVLHNRMDIGTQLE